MHLTLVMKMYNQRTITHCYGSIMHALMAELFPRLELIYPDDRSIRRQCPCLHQTRMRWRYQSMHTVRWKFYLYKRYNFLFYTYYSMISAKIEYVRHINWYALLYSMVIIWHCNLNRLNIIYRIAQVYFIIFQ